MAEKATLIVEAKTDSLVKAKKDMDDLVPSAKEVERETRNVKKEMDKVKPSVDDATESTRRMTDALDEAEGGARRATDGMGKTRKEMDRVKPTVDRAKRSTGDLTNALDDGDQGLKDFRAGVDDVDDALDDIPPGANNARRGIDNFNDSLGRGAAATKAGTQGFNSMASSFKVNQSALQNTAFQLQDITVQLQAGTRASVALSQQLPQLLGAFGAGGAILGLFASLGAAAFAPLIDGLFDTDSAVDILATTLEELDASTEVANDGIIDLTKSLRDLEGISKSAFAAEIQEQILSTEEALTKNKDAVSELVKEQGLFSLGMIKQVKAFDRGELSARDLADKYNDIFLAMGDGGDRFRKFRSELEQLAQGEEKVTARLDRLREALKTGTSGSTEGGRADDDDESERERKRQERLKEIEAKALARRLALEKAKADALAAAEADEANRRAENLEKQAFAIEDSFKTQETLLQEGYNRRTAIIKAALKNEVFEEDEAQQLLLANKQRYNEATRMLDVARISQMGSFFGQSASILQQGLGEQNALTKAAFAAQKLAAIPQMIVATETGAAQALSLGPFIGPPLAALVKGLGYASIGTVAGTTLAGGRALGGQVRPGEAYRVGEYGPETLVMGSNGGTITPAGGGDMSGKIDVVTNVKIIGGNSDAQVTTETTQVDRRFIADVVVDLMGNQSSRARQALHSTSNVTPRGSR